MQQLALVSFFLYCLLLFAGCGLPFSKLIPANLPGLHRITAIFCSGITCVTVFSTIAYFNNASCHTIFIALNLSTAASWIGFFFLSPRPVTLSWLRRNAKIIAVWSAGMVALLLPAVIGGLQFTLFQGNHHDAFNYLESSLTHSLLPVQLLQQGTPMAIVNAGGFQNTQVYLNFRPSVAILFGTLSHFWSAYTLGNHYAFLVSFVAIASLALGSLVQSLAPRLQAWQAVGLSLCVLLGFWGQYVIDINAWSQIAWLPLFISAVAFPLAVMPGSERSSTCQLKVQHWIPWVVVLAGSVYFYPEGAAFSLLPLLALLAGAIFAGGMIRHALGLGIIGLLVALLFLPVYKPNVQMLFVQGKAALSAVDWWKYFQAFLGGQDGFGGNWFANIADGIGGLMGVYYITPAHDTPIWLATIWRIGLMVFGCALLAISLPVIWSDDRRTHLRWRVLAAMLALLLCETAALLFMHQYWSAGKALSYYAPVALAAILAALCHQYYQCPSYRLVANLLLIVLLCSAMFMAGRRVLGAARPDGVHYASPYPSIQNPLLKTTFNFGDVLFLHQLRRDDYVSIDIDNPWTQEYVQMQLMAHGIAFFIERPIKANRYSEEIFDMMHRSRPPSVRIKVQVDHNQRFPSFIQVERLNLAP